MLVRKIDYVDTNILNKNIKPIHVASSTGGGVGTPHTHPNLSYLDTLSDPVVDENIREEVFNDPNSQW